MKKLKVLFLCVHNSARSQMAEAFANTLAGNKLEAQSAGLEPGVLNLIVVEAMKEVGIDLSRNKTKSVVDKLREGEQYHYIIAVCSKEAAEKCPIFPGVAQRLHWPFDDPSQVTGTPAEKLIKIRKIRDEIKSTVETWKTSSNF